jgi:cytochrome c oxidase subunit II
MLKWPKYLLFLMFLISILLILAGCKAAPASPSVTVTNPPVTTTSPSVLPTSTITPIPSTSPSATNGQRIYNTASSDSGQPITYTGGPGMMMPINLTCAECHGPQGQGGRIDFMMQSFDVPNITWPELTGPYMDHPPYTEETLKRAITQGLDPAGDPLEYPMPRWQMPASDLNDLVVLIKTLK